MTSLITRRLVDLTADEFARCRELTFRRAGLMEEEAVERRTLEQVFRPYRYSQVVLAYNNEQIVGWCLLQPVYKQSRYLAYFYVDPLHRKQGYGRLLFNEASKQGRFKLAVKPDFTNRQFFRSFENQWIEQRENAKV